MCLGIVLIFRAWEVWFRYSSVWSQSCLDMLFLFTQEGFSHFLFHFTFLIALLKMEDKIETWISDFPEATYGLQNQDWSSCFTLTVASTGLAVTQCQENRCHGDGLQWPDWRRRGLQIAPNGTLWTEQADSMCLEQMLMGTGVRLCSAHPVTAEMPWWGARPDASLFSHFKS